MIWATLLGAVLGFHILHNSNQLEAGVLFQPHTEKIMAEWTIFNDPLYPGYSIRAKFGNQLCDPNVNQIHGYLDAGEDLHYYFWFFESRSDPTKDPVVLWLNGGPGCSSFTGLLMELGPCNVDRSGLNTTINPYSWNEVSNLLFLDQPVGTGFSYSDSHNDSTSKEAATDVYAFLRVFFASFGQYSKLPFHVAGESYAGHYIPMIAHEIFTNNKKYAETASEYINLKSIAIGNGITDSVTQNKYFVDMTEDTKYGPILTKKIRDQMQSPAGIICGKIFLDPFLESGLNPYDIRLEVGDPILDDYSDAIEKWLNQPEILKELGVKFPHNGCSDEVMERFVFAGDEALPIMRKIPELLESGIRVLIYAGDADYICNWIGNKAWVLELDWEGQQGMNNAKDHLWVSNITKREAGEYRRFKNFAFLKVFEASHFVPFHQPQHSLEFFRKWLRNEDVTPISK